MQIFTIIEQILSASQLKWIRMLQKVQIKKDKSNKEKKKKQIQQNQNQKKQTIHQQGDRDRQNMKLYWLRETWRKKF